MGRIQTAKLAYDVAGAVYRANLVRQDPAVVKAAKQARDDWRQAGRSTAELGREVQSAWQRVAGR
jgi:hypothetical protein